MSELLIPKFYYYTMAQYQALETKDPYALYFIKGTSIIYKGDAPYGSSVKEVKTLPAVGDAVPGVQYALTEGDTAGLYVLNDEKSAFVAVTLTKKYVDDTFISNVEYDASGDTANWTFSRPNGAPIVINVPKDNFLSAADFNRETNELTLTLVNGSSFDVNLEDLIDTYSVESTDGIQLEISADKKITATLLVSEDEDNAAVLKSDGIFVEKTPISANITDASTNEEAAGAKAVYDMFAQMAWQE